MEVNTTDASRHSFVQSNIDTLEQGVKSNDFTVNNEDPKTSKLASF